MASDDDTNRLLTGISSEESESVGGSPSRQNGIFRMIAGTAILIAALVGAVSTVLRQSIPSDVSVDAVALPVIAPQATSVVYGNDADNTCPAGYARITDLGECRAAMPWLAGGDPDGFNGEEESADFPSGCYSCAGRNKNCAEGVWFNKHSSGKKNKWARPICQQGFAVKTGAIVFVGDSDIDYWHTSADAVPGSYNLGIGGQTCKDVFKEIDFILKRFLPKKVVLICGENDLPDASVKKTFARWTAVVEKITAAGVPIVQLGTKPEADSKELHGKYREYDAMIKAFVDESFSTDYPPPVTFIDTYPAFIERGNKDKFYASDQLHLSPKGYALFDKWLQNGLSNTFGCVLWNGDKCEKQAPGVNVIKASTTECPDGYEKLSNQNECEAAVGLVKLDGNTFQGSETSEEWPVGCYYCKGVADCQDGTWFNKAGGGKARQGARLYCKIKM
jgi:lysophospholipase L1-like esterase